MTSNNFKRWRTPEELPDGNLFSRGIDIQIKVMTKQSEIISCYWDKDEKQPYQQHNFMTDKEYLNWETISQWCYLFSPDENPPIYYENLTLKILLVIAYAAIIHSVFTLL